MKRILDRIRYSQHVWMAYVLDMLPGTCWAEAVVGAMSSHRRSLVTCIGKGARECSKQDGCYCGKYMPKGEVQP